MAPPEMIPDAPAPAKKGWRLRCRKVAMKTLMWSIYSGGAVFAGIFVILCFFTWQEFKKLEDKLRGVDPTVDATFDSAASRNVTITHPVTADGSILVNINALASLFEGAAINAAILLFSVCFFYALSASLLMCTCTTLAHPARKFYRGLCCGGSFWLMFQSLNSAIQFQSYQALTSSLSKKYDPGFNQDILVSCFSFGYMAAIAFLAQSIAFWFWRDKTVSTVHVGPG